MSSFTGAFDEMDRYLVGDEDEIEEARDDAGAERLMRAVRYRRRKLQVAVEVVQAEKARLDEWLDAQRKRYDTSRLEEHLTNYLRHLQSQKPKLASTELPSGWIKSRVLGPQWNFDSGRFLGWAKEHQPEMVRIPEPEINKVEAKKRLTVVPSFAIERLIHLLCCRRVLLEGEFLGLEFSEDRDGNIRLDYELLPEFVVLSETGQYVPGIEITPQPRSYTVVTD